MAIKRIWIALIYLIAYTVISTSVNDLIHRYPTIRSMENAIYDHFQCWWTVDSRKDYRFDKLQPKFDEFRLINLDANFFDLERERVRRAKLAKLLDAIAEGPDVKAVFLDFLFVPVPGSQREDSLLLKSMRTLGDRLILPFSVPSGVQEDDEIIPHKKKPQLLYPNANSGYLDYRAYVNEEHLHRKVQIGKGRDSVSSALLSLIKLINKKRRLPYLRNIPEVMEINFIFRNHPPLHPTSGKLLYSRAVRWVDGSTVIDQINPPESDKIVFIGLFDTLSSKYDLPIDQFTTPVSREMPGIYLIINSYLNMVTQSYLRPVSTILVGLLNLLLALAGLIYYKRLMGVKRKWWWEGIELTVGTLFFLGMLNFLYLFFHFKFPFVVTTVFFIANQHLYRKYNYLITKLQ